jgi:hypothetical protein
VNSIYFASAIALATTFAASIGVGEQEAFELLLVWAFAFYATAYLALFAIPLLARKELEIRPAAWMRAAALSGFVVTLLYIVLSIFPLIDVQSSWEYSLKTGAMILGANLVGAWLYHWRSKTRAPFTQP